MQPPRSHPRTPSDRPLRRWPRLLGRGPVACALVACAPGAFAQGGSPEDLSDTAQQQIAEVLALKDSFRPAEQKMSSDLVLAARKLRGLPLGAVADGIVNLETIPGTDHAVQVDIRGKVNGKLRASVAAGGGSVEGFSKALGRLTATVPLPALESLAADPNVAFIRRPGGMKTNVGSLTSQGYVTHTVKQAIAQSGANGSGVKVGVLSDSASPYYVASRIASGDLGPNTVVLPNQDGGYRSNEGVAMMEIVQDMAPGAQVYFATAIGGQTNFANNIRALAAAGCSVIVDDVTYFEEAVFQDDVVARAVNDVTAQGVLYFSAAGNSGSFAHGTSGTWEGDFANGGAYTAPVPGGDAKTYQVHRFQTAPSAQVYDVALASSPYRHVTLQWSDPLGTSANDYDLFVLDGTGANVVNFSVNVQNGSQDPIEELVASGAPMPGAGNRLVVVKTAAAAPRALSVHTFGGQLSVATGGATTGHNAGANTVSMAATFWNSARTGTRPFNGTNNPAEVFSSDGPRKVFYRPDGSPITPGNFLFNTNGGTTLLKPDLTATDGNVCVTPGFSPFFGTSAAAPHAAGIAALLKSARPGLTNAQILNILRGTALDNEAPEPDPTGGYGVISAQAAMQQALTLPTP